MMNRAKLTPCRKVGLSRKKNTPCRTVDSLMTESSITQKPVTRISIRQQKISTIVHDNEQLIEINCDTPCRQVGLSRKRKTPTPLDAIETMRSVSTTSLIPSPLVKEALKNDKEINVTNEKDPNQRSCATRLSKKFSSAAVPYMDELENSVIIHKHLMSKNEFHKSVDESPLRDFEECDEKNKDNVEEPNDELSKLDNIKKYYMPNDAIIISKCEPSKLFGELYENNDVFVEELNGNSDKHKSTIPENSDVEHFVKDKNSFIKVCYKKVVKVTEKSEQNTRTKNLSAPKKPIFSRKIYDDDDDDFDVSPKKIKSKNIFGRYETDVGSLRKRVSNKDSVPLKKSLSVGDKNLKNASLSGASSESSITDCFVKLVQLKNMTERKATTPTPQELSDEDFDTPTPTPPINKRSKVNELENRVKKKRNILDELKRAKMYKKLHDINELKSLTSTWENGCKQALTDLLKQLNNHTEINMEMLLKKLNIPADFMPLSQ